MLNCAYIRALFHVDPGTLTVRQYHGLLHRIPDVLMIIHGGRDEMGRLARQGERMQNPNL
jgi:hypothetical protein